MEELLNKICTISNLTAETIKSYSKLDKMGMYDSVMVRCPKCGEEHEFQSKSGECLLMFTHLKIVLMMLWQM